MVLGFVGIEKAFDTVPREMATVVLEAEAMMVRAMYERTKGRILIEHMMLTEFKAIIGMKQRSALNRS